VPKKLPLTPLTKNLRNQKRRLNHPQLNQTLPSLDQKAREMQLQMKLKLESKLIKTPLRLPKIQIRKSLTQRLTKLQVRLLPQLKLMLTKRKKK